MKMVKKWLQLSLLSSLGFFFVALMDPIWKRMSIYEQNGVKLIKSQLGSQKVYRVAPFSTASCRSDRDHCFLNIREPHKITYLMFFGHRDTLHSLQDFTNDLKKYLDPNKVVQNTISTDFLILQNGDVIQINSDIPGKYSHQAGISCWQNETNLNQKTVGINMAYGPDGMYTAAQIHTVGVLSRYLVKKNKINPSCVVIHSDVAVWGYEEHEFKLGRKKDPVNHPGQVLYKNHGVGTGISLTDHEKYPLSHPVLMGKPSVEYVIFLVQNIGYSVIKNNLESEKEAILAFARHYYPDWYEQLSEEIKNTGTPQQLVDRMTQKMVADLALLNAKYGKEALLEEETQRKNQAYFDSFEQP